MNSLISTEAPAEMFKDLVEEAVDHQGVGNSDESTAYLVYLLDSFVRSGARFAAAGADPHRSLAEALLTARQAGSAHAKADLRFVGDFALFLVGFFADGLQSSIAGANTYVVLGESAYGALAVSQARPNARLFRELATDFVRFADVLTEVSENCALTDPSNQLRLYERWLATGSERNARQLGVQGIHVGVGSVAIH